MWVGRGGCGWAGGDRWRQGVDKIMRGWEQKFQESRYGCYTNPSGESWMAVPVIITYYRLTL